MKHIEYSAALLLFTLMLASCGGGDNATSDPAPAATNTPTNHEAGYGFSYTNPGAFGKTSLGVAGLGWTATTPDDPTVDGGTTHTHTGVTNLGGEFLLTYATSCFTEVSIAGTITTCTAGSIQPPQLTMCDAPLPQVAGPVNVVNALINYSVYDLAPDEQSAHNLQSAWLMANTSGDPLKTGIVLPDYSKRAAPCNGNSIVWSAPTDQFRQSAGGLQAATETADANAAHPWHPDDEVRAVARSGFLCSRAGVYWTTNHGPSFDPTNVTVPEYGGNANLIVDLDGTITGWLDFSGTWFPGPSSTWPTTYPSPITFSAQLSDHIAAGGKTQFTVIPDASPWPNTTVTLQFPAEGAVVSYQTADGSHWGSTLDTFDALLPNSYIFYGPVEFPKYVFLLKNVSYTRPGHTAPETFVGSLEIGYNSTVQAHFLQWPPLPWGGKYQEGWLNLSGTLDTTTNIVTLTWDQDDLSTGDGSPLPPAPTKTVITLQLDPNAITVGGTFVGYDGSPWGKLTFPGCRQ